MHTNTNVGKKSSADIGLLLSTDNFNIWKIVFEHFTIQLILSCVAFFLSIFNNAAKYFQLVEGHRFYSSFLRLND